MRGAEGGVVAKLIEIAPNHIIAIHCICHVIALSAKEGLETSRIARNTDQLARGIATEFQRSTNANRDLDALQMQFNEKNTPCLRILQFHSIRWLCRQTCLQRYIDPRVLPSLLEFFRQQSLEYDNTWYHSHRHVA